MKNEILALGFETSDSYEEDENIMITAINRSLNVISFEYKPFYKTLDFEVLDKSDAINLKKADNEFLSLHKIYKTENYKKENGVYEVLGESFEYEDYTQLLNNTVILYSKGLYTFVYERIPIQISKETSDDFELDFDVGTKILLPLLCAFYLYRDDDATKADIYYNDYELKLSNLKLNGGVEIAGIKRGVNI